MADDAEVSSVKDEVASLEALFKRHYGRLVRLLSVIDDDGADAVQEAFIQAYLHWGRVAHLDDPVAWIRRVAINRIINGSRHRRRGTRAARRVAASLAPSEMETRDSAVDLERAVRSLPARQRAVVVLFYFGELRVNEVADAMGISAGAVKAHLHQARASLHAALEVSRER
jgi:RNA polymerase sigma factor (sigma-70 family)